MRVVALLFSIYLIGITSLPCPDDLNCGETTDSEVVDTHQHEDHQDVDQCQPFCICQECYTGISLANASRLEVEWVSQTSPAKVNTTYNRQIVFSIWDPPRQV